MYRSKIHEALVGKTIRSFVLNDSRDLIAFATDGGQVTLYAEGDCCSQSWIEGIDAPDALIGTVLNVEDIDMPDLGEQTGTAFHPDPECVRYYGLKITTNKGDCVLDYRNDSNGYYGGSLELVESPTT